MTRVLEAQAVFYAYEGAGDVLKEVSAEIRSGAITGIIGPNGSGKSTLLRLLAGLRTPRKGRVRLDGEALAAHSRRTRAQAIAFLPQAVNPAFSLTVFEVVCLGRYPRTGATGALRPADFDVARRCLADTRSEALAGRNFMSLSGGERQRVLLASILAQEPDLLLLDEPTAALDLHHEVEVFALLENLAHQGYGVGVVTHDLNLAAQYCQEILLLGQDHRVAASGPPAEVFEADRLSRAYGAPIRVGQHPFAPTPFVAAAKTEGPA